VFFVVVLYDSLFAIGLVFVFWVHVEGYEVVYFSG